MNKDNNLVWLLQIILFTKSLKPGLHVTFFAPFFSILKWVECIPMVLPSRHSSVRKTSTHLVSHCEWQYNRSWFQASPMPAHRYIEENSWAAILANKRSAGVEPEVNLGEYVKHTPLLSAYKAPHSGLETQRRCHQKSKTGISGPIKRTCVLQKFLKKFL